LNKRTYNSLLLFIVGLLIYLNIFDIITTYIAIDVTKIAYEYNPFLKKLVEEYGVLKTVLPIKLVFICLIIFLAYRVMKKSTVREKVIIAVGLFGADCYYMYIMTKYNFPLFMDSISILAKT
jgi:hypothetical protein